MTNDQEKMKWEKKRKKNEGEKEEKENRFQKYYIGVESNNTFFLNVYNNVKVRIN